MERGIELDPGDVASIKMCDAAQQVRYFDNSLYIRSGEESEFVVPRMEYTPLDVESTEVRLLRLHPTDDVSKHVRCDLEIHQLSQLPPFIAIQNARGYRKIKEAIEVDGQALIISAALERFLRYLRTRITEPTRVWVRYACIVESNPQEQETYWTRRFSDRMYAAASRVFDMHEINSYLIENGYFEKVLDPRYAKWTKDWYGSPNEITLPRVCPVRLGTQPDNDTPTMQYQYMPLDMITDEIRIICVMPSEDMAAPIVMHVAHCPIKCEVDFIALSYRWGTDVSPEQVILNGQTKVIRKNLADAIRFLRMKQAIVPLWIDALSINQEDVMERDRQVPRMGEIYDNAMSVYSWVGPRAEDTDVAIDLMEELAKHPMIRMNEAGEFHFGEWGSVNGGRIRYGRNTIKPTQLARMCAALYKFLTRQYFRRSWVLQEVAWGSNATIIAGCRKVISFDTLDKAACNLHDMLTRDPSLAAYIQNADSSIKELDIRLLAYARKMYYFRYLMSKGLGGGSAFAGLWHTFKDTSPGFLDALILARDFDCTDPKDRIYALWNLARDKTGLNLKPEYSKPYEQVYTEFAQAWASQHNLLDILGAVEATQASSVFYDSAPSWCPNWNMPATASSLVRKDYLPMRPMSAINDRSGKLYSADGNPDHEAFDSPLFSFEDNALHCIGLLFDRIKIIFGDAPDIPAGTAPKSSWRFHYWMDRIQKHYHCHDIDTYGEPLRAACAMFHGDSIAAWPAVDLSGYVPDDCSRNERYVCLPAISRHVLPYANSYDRTEVWTVVDAVLRGRRPFVTENGYMGLTPAYTAQESNIKNESWRDAELQLAIVAGCPVPLLLREREDRTFQLIGTCFVQGWMDGEWMETMMGAEDPKEFWQAMGDGAKLIII